MSELEKEMLLLLKELNTYLDTNNHTSIGVHIILNGNHKYVHGKVNCDFDNYVKKVNIFLNSRHVKLKRILNDNK